METGLCCLQQAGGGALQDSFRALSVQLGLLNGPCPSDHQNKGPKHPVYVYLYMLGMVAATCVISGEFWVTGQAFLITDGTFLWFLHGCIALG